MKRHTIYRVLPLALLLGLSACGGGGETGKADKGAATQADTTKTQPAETAWSLDKPMEIPNLQNFESKVIEVGTFQEFYDNIGSNRTLKLKEGVNFLIPKKMEREENPHVKLGWGLEIKGVENMKIVGLGSKPVAITQPDASLPVLNIDASGNVVFENLNVGHSQRAGCAASVLNFNKTKGVFINNSILYGSGYEGITTNEVEGLQCVKTEIRECSTNMLSLVRSYRIAFFDCQIRENVKGAGKMYIGASENVGFRNCVFEKNSTQVAKAPVREEMIKLEKSKGVELRDCTIRDNVAFSLANVESEVKLTNVQQSGNSWEKKGITSR